MVSPNNVLDKLTPRADSIVVNYVNPPYKNRTDREDDSLLVVSADIDDSCYKVPSVDTGKDVVRYRSNTTASPPLVFLPSIVSASLVSRPIITSLTRAAIVTESVANTREFTDFSSYIASLPFRFANEAFE